MTSSNPTEPHDLTDRERQVLEAVIRTYVDTAEPAGSRNVARRHDLGVSPATVRNTMSDLEEKGYLSHPHTSAGRIPTDLAYRFYVDRLIRPVGLSVEEQAQLAEQLSELSAVERVVSRAAQALGLLANELGIAAAPRLQEAVLEKIDLIPVSSSKILMIATIRSGLARTVYVDLPGHVPPDTLERLTSVMNERLAGHTFSQIRLSLTDRLRDSLDASATGAADILNIFMQAGDELFLRPDRTPESIHLGRTSVLASQPEFTSGEQLKELIELTEQQELLAAVLGRRAREGGLRITIGTENEATELAGLTVVTSEYSVGGLKGVVGVIGPTRMPYDKVVAIVDYTSSLVTKILQQ